MITNVSIDLEDGPRNLIANMLDGKLSKRLATRKEITQLTHLIVQRLVSNLAAGEPETEVEEDDDDWLGESNGAADAAGDIEEPTFRERVRDDLITNRVIVDDIEVPAGRDRESYLRGVAQVDRAVAEGRLRK